MAHGIKRGDLVEFTDEAHFDYTAGDVRSRYGVALETKNDTRTVRVRLADRTEVVARHIIAYGWAGWIPEDLEPICEELDRADNMFFDEDDYL